MCVREREMGVQKERDSIGDVKCMCVCVCVTHSMLPEPSGGEGGWTGGEKRRAVG